MKNEIKVLLLATILITLFHGITRAQSFCGIYNMKDVYFNEEANRILKRGSAANFQGKYFLRLQFHILRRSDGTGGRTVGDVYTAMSKLEEAFNPHNICFRSCLS